MPDKAIPLYPFIIGVEATRKEGTTRKQFRDHYETFYVPLLKKLVGKTHPLTWTRRYNLEEGEGPFGVPKLLIGTDADMGWDCYSEMTFADELHCQQFITLMHSDEVEPMLEEERKFTEPEKLRMIVLRRDITIDDSARAER
ncbi:hypothetical protein P171DRAFT_517561 [Karstenula rhodostoma CBS 690.94]|uniref:EthD domain-containing protein n=1 Tax=Karstenula rhodostoma CBS 690.94 TaxID=1392251 RepID=A0A9P4UI59_9PLEO|nr:hypothetical protein P171DRAFT_517561 [Karstenula rhodostoma CBS 690.94]